MQSESELRRELEPEPGPRTSPPAVDAVETDTEPSQDFDQDGGGEPEEMLADEPIQRRRSTKTKRSVTDTGTGYAIVESLRSLA